MALLPAQSPAFVYNDVIDAGATFYRTGQLYNDKAMTQLLVPNPAGSRVLRASLMTAQGVSVANFSCAWLDETTASFVWLMSRDITATLKAGTYLFNIDTDEPPNGSLIDITIRRVIGQMTVNIGQRKV